MTKLTIPQCGDLELVKVGGGIESLSPKCFTNCAEARMSYLGELRRSEARMP